MVDFLATASATIFFAEEANDRRSSGVESSQGRSFVFGWSDAGGVAETDESLVNGGTGLMTESDHFFVRVVCQPFLRKRNATC